MNSIVTTKILSEKNSFAGRDWYYPFREVKTRLPEDKAAKVVKALASRYAKITKDWSVEKNSEWICRVYLSVKMILSATLNLNSCAYAEDKNLRIVSPYLKYYAALSLARGVVYTLPEYGWGNGRIDQIAHSTAGNCVASYLGDFNQDLSKKFSDTFFKLKADRELILYKAPSSGDENIADLDDFDWVFTLLAECAQLNSEILEKSIIKNTHKEMRVFLKNHIHNLSLTEIEGHGYFDREDAYRLDYLRRKYPLPPNILHIMIEGHTEDFFGAWVAQSDEKGLFDPDKDTRRIFDVP